MTVAQVAVNDFNVNKAGGEGCTLAYDDAAGPLSPIVVAGAPGDLVDVTLSLDTSAYASGDVLAATQEIANAVRFSGGRAVLQSLTLIDLDDQGAALTLYFLQANQAIGTENAAPDIDDTEVLDVLGFVDIATADYKDLGGAKVVSLKNIGLMLEAAASSTSIYVAAVNGSGTPTYTASGLRLRLGLLWD